MSDVKKIYLDMDGVLCDFHARFKEIYGEDALGFRDRKNFTVHWPNFIENKQFETLDWFPGGQELLEYLKGKNVEVEILSSSGGEQHHEEVKRQKIVWLNSKGINYKVNIVPGRKHKTTYSTAGSILIDDTEDIIVAFNAAEGIGILHKDVNITLERLEILLNT